MAPIPRLKPHTGWPVLSYGFRPFFLLGALYAGLAMLVWLPAFKGELTLHTAFAPRDWHVHEMLYGYVPAVVTGFLLTAIPNWTGRLPIQGNSLLALVLLWLAGRAAVTFSASIGWGIAMAVDGAFLALVAAAASREIAAGRNWGNLKVVALILLLAVGNLCFHLEAHFFGAADHSIRVGLAVMVMLIALIGGRIVPSFTRNWLARQNPGRLPIPVGRFDLMVIAASAAVLVLWIAQPQGSLVSAALLTVGALHIWRLTRWAGDRTTRDRLVLILHVAYAFVPVGFVLLGLAAVDLVPVAAGLHAWAGGAVGTMTLAVMTRATLGHTGRTLMASKATQAIYVAVLLAAVVRITAVFAPTHSMILLTLAAAFWGAAFLGFGAVYGPMIVSRRADP